MSNNEKEMLQTLKIVRDLIEAEVDKKIEGKRPNFAAACSASLHEIYATIAKMEVDSKN